MWYLIITLNSEYSKQWSENPVDFIGGSVEAAIFDHHVVD